MWRLGWAVPIWALYILVTIPLYILGWILVPIAAFKKAYHSSSTKDGKLIFHFDWRFMFPFDNYEDGIANDTYWKSSSEVLQIVYWTCVRNPLNNLRITPLLSCKVDPTKVKWIGSRAEPANFDRKPAELEWFFAWQGLYANYWKQFLWEGSIWRFWIGWKLYPNDVNGVTEYRKQGAGFALQLKKIE